MAEPVEANADHEIVSYPVDLPNKARACYAFQRYTWYDFSMTRQPYPSDVSDEERAFVAPSLTFMTEDTSQRFDRLSAPRDYSLREVFNGLRWIVRASAGSARRTGAPWRMMPNDLPPWHTVSQQTQRWLKAGVFETLVHDLRALVRDIEGRAPAPRAVIVDACAGYDGHQRRKGSKVHMAVDTLGQVLAAKR